MVVDVVFLFGCLAAMAYVHKWASRGTGVYYYHSSVSIFLLIMTILFWWDFVRTWDQIKRPNSN